MRVARGLVDHQRVDWSGGTLEVLPTPGHTKGSISLLAEIDGTSVAFTGDLIAAPGRVPTLRLVPVGIVRGGEPVPVAPLALEPPAGISPG